jgi:hypothetical protein
MPESANLLPFVRFDDFDLRIELSGPFENEGDAAYVITQSIYINGENLAPNNPIDLEQLAKSCQLSGAHSIVTCGCGNAGCAGIEDGIRVTQLDDRIVWEVPTPLSYYDLPDEERDDAYRGKRTYRKFAFRPDAYLATVQGGLRKARALLFGELQPVECSPYGMTPEHLLKLNPLVFSARGAPAGCTITGSEIQLDQVRDIIIDGIRYHIDELPLSAAIKALNDWSEWEPKHVPNGCVYGALAAPDHVVRKRTKQLAQHLASMQIMGGTVEFQSNVRKYVGIPCKRKVIIEGQVAPWRVQRSANST